MEAVRGFPTHLETSLAAGVVSVRYPLLYGFPLKLGEHDTDIQHRPPHRGGGIKLFRRGHKLHIVLLELLARIAELTVEAISPEQVSQISGYLDTWENVSFDDKRRVVDLMITTIAATSDSLNITWKI